MACIPPFCMGSSGYCNCNCNCCPPDPCYVEWMWEYKCGSAEGPEPCDCSPAPFTKSSLGIDFPEFITNDKDFVFRINDDEDMVSALATGCTIPCQTIRLVMTTEGCCFYHYDDFHFRAIGGGIIRINPAAPEACSGTFTVFINNILMTSSGVEVGDCEDIWVTINPPSDDCCGCCLVKSRGTPLPPRNFSATRKIANGINKIKINPKAYKQNLINKINKQF